MIEPADLIWRDGQPYSQAFNDIYHDKDGVAEVERVFLAPANFGELLNEGRPLVVGELGFGTGLNFAVIARQCLAAGVHLHFISFEAAPVAPAAFRDMAALRQTREPVYAELADRYPPLLPGWHRRSLAGGRIRLSVSWGDADTGMKTLTTRQRQPVDVWLLDGFAPDRNPDMWSDPLLQAVGATATRGTRVCTFTAAGRVRRGLMAAGFEMRRVDQQPFKRESLAGIFSGITTGTAGAGRQRSLPPAQATVIGAGIAGATAARELAESGIAVTVMEQAHAPATGASGIPATVMHPRLHHDGSVPANLKATAYAHALAATLDHLNQPGSGIHRTGALQIPSPNFPVHRLQAVADYYARTGLGVQLVSAAEARELAGDGNFKLEAPALWFPDACLLNTPRFTKHLLDHPLIELRTDSKARDWPDGAAVLACGIAARQFEGAAYLELGSVHGQLDLVAPGDALLSALQLPVTGNGYVTPLPDPAGVPAAGNGGVSLFAAGATYEYEPWPSERASAANEKHVARLVGAGFMLHGHHKGVRCVSSDRNPVTGPLFPLPAASDPATAGPGSVDRFVSVGHGSMGTVSSHLAATLIGAALSGQFEPLGAAELALVSPERFRIRQARRGYRFGAEP